MPQLPVDVRASIRLFAFYLGNGTLVMKLLGDIDYQSALGENGSVLEQIFAIYTNVLEIDENGKVTNDEQASYRAAQWIRAYCDPQYEVEPPFEQWECELWL